MVEPSRRLLNQLFGKALAAAGISSLTMADTSAEPTSANTAREPAALRVVVREQGYASHREKILEERSGEPHSVVYSPYATGLELVLVLDQPLASTVMDAKAIAAMGLQPGDAMTLGRKQVLAMLPELPTASDIGDGVLESPKIDYIASLMLADGWDALAKAVGGTLVVAVPSDDVIIAASLLTDEDRAKFKAYVEGQYENANRSVSKLPYVRQGGRWIALPQSPQARGGD